MTGEFDCPICGSPWYKIEEYLDFQPHKKWMLPKNLQRDIVGYDEICYSCGAYLRSVYSPASLYLISISNFFKSMDYIEFCITLNKMDFYLPNGGNHGY